MKNQWMLRDFLIIVAGLFMLTTMMLLIQHKSRKSADGAVDSPGQLVVTVTWPEGDNDVDVWLTGPGEPHPVGFHAPNGRLWNLLRDDLGKDNDPMPGNFENAYTRGEPAGLYVVNVHCFRCATFPIPVTVELREKAEDGTTVQIALAKVNLDHDKQEKTAFQFLVSGGKVGRDSVVNTYRTLLGYSQ